jgi:hypothetical protein
VHPRRGCMSRVPGLVLCPRPNSEGTDRDGVRGVRRNRQARGPVAPAHVLEPKDLSLRSGVSFRPGSPAAVREGRRNQRTDIGARAR